jgi:hypothetical protein
MESDYTRKHKEATKHLQEAEEFAKWAKQDRKSRVPQLKDDQRNQLKEYLQLVEQHSINMMIHPSRGKDGNCNGCPVLAPVRNALNAKPAYA